MRFTVFLGLLCTVAIAGCGSGVDVQSVTGRVTLDGAPIKGATVTFSPVEGGGGKAAVGIADADGQFKLADMGSGAEGAVAGEYEVGVLWFKPSADSSNATGESGGGATPEKDDAKSRSGVSGPESLLPVAYQDPKSSGLKATVVKGKNEFNFELDSKYKPKK